MYANPILLTFCALLYYDDLGEHMRCHRIEKLVMPLNASAQLDYALWPSVPRSRPSPANYIIHPFLKSVPSTIRMYNRKVLNRWHLLVRLSLNLELTAFRRPSSRIEEAIERTQTQSFSTRLKNNFLEMRQKNETSERTSKLMSLLSTWNKLTIIIKLLRRLYIGFLRNYKRQNIIEELN